jgi:N6-adenosine-specific RNA methylase IME4
MTYRLCDLTIPATCLTGDTIPQYSVIVADPPWWYADQRKVRKDGKTPTKGIGACHHYNQLRTPVIATMRFPKLVANPEHCYLFMWTTCPLLPDALQVMNGWGFRYSTVAFVWVKMNPKRWQEAQGDALQMPLWPGGPTFLENVLSALTFYGPGHHTASNVELVLLGIRGSAPSPAQGCKEEQIIFAPRLEDHSRKPEEMQSRIEHMYPFYGKGSLCELFARRDRRGWDCYGNENIFDPYPEKV